MIDTKITINDIDYEYSTLDKLSDIETFDFAKIWFLNAMSPLSESIDLDSDSFIA